MDILECLNTEEAFDRLEKEGNELERRTAARMMSGIISSLRRRSGESLDIECIMYTQKNGLIAASDGAEEMLEANREQWNG